MTDHPKLTDERIAEIRRDIAACRHRIADVDAVFEELARLRTLHAEVEAREHNGVVCAACGGALEGYVNHGDTCPRCRGFEAREQAACEHGDCRQHYGDSAAWCRKCLTADRDDWKAQFDLVKENGRYCWKQRAETAEHALEAEKQKVAALEKERDESAEQLRTLARLLPAPPWFDAEGGSDWEPWAKWLDGQVSELAALKQEIRK